MTMTPNAIIVFRPILGAEGGVELGGGGGGGGGGTVLVFFCILVPFFIGIDV
jgi:hypothetical protein